MPVNLEDLLARRTRALFLNAKASREIAAEAASLMAQEMGHDPEWEKNQLESYYQLVSYYI
jgi:glycerol-3-phosphate dehydrogenase